MNRKQDKVDVTIPIIHPDEWIDKTQIFSIDACTNNSNDGSNKSNSCPDFGSQTDYLIQIDQQSTSYTSTIIPSDSLYDPLYGKL